MQARHYRHENGRLAYYADDRLQYLADDVALLVDAELGVLVSHGPPDVVRRKYAALNSPLGKQHGLLALAESVVVLQGCFSLDELNACLLQREGVLRVLARHARQSSQAASSALERAAMLA